MDQKSRSHTTGFESPAADEVAEVSNPTRDPFTTSLKSEISRHLRPEQCEKLWTLAFSLHEQWSDCKGKAIAFKASRDRVAKTLCEIRTLLAAQGLFNKVLDQAGIKRRTAYDMIVDYGRVCDLPEAVREEAARQHVDLTAKRFESKIESMKEGLQAAATSEMAGPLIAELKAQKRKSAARDTRLPEIRATRRKTLVAQTKAFLESFKADHVDFRMQTEALLNEIVSEFGFAVTVSETGAVARFGLGEGE